MVTSAETSATVTSNSAIHRNRRNPRTLRIIMCDSLAVAAYRKENEIEIHSWIDRWRDSCSPSRLFLLCIWQCAGRNNRQHHAVRGIDGEEGPTRSHRQRNAEDR